MKPTIGRIVHYTDHDGEILAALILGRCVTKMRLRKVSKEEL